MNHTHPQKMCEVTSWTDEKRAGEKREEALGKKLWLKLQLFGTGLYLAFLLSKGWDVPGGSDGKESACNAVNLDLIPSLGTWVPWRREWQPTLLFLPREFHEQRSLVGYGPWGHKELDTTERLTLSLSYKGYSTVPTLHCFL